MRIFKTKYFAKWAKKNLLTDKLLFEAAHDIARNHYDANLGGYVIKKRIATKGRGKSGSVRTIVAFKKGSHCFFVYGFEKSEKKNITINEEKAFKLVAKELVGFSDITLDEYAKETKLVEVYDE